MEAALHGIEHLTDPTVIVTMLAASALGLLFGAIPGLTATMAVALLVPFTFFMDPVPALVAMVTVSAMAIFAGDIPAALVRIPGTPASAAYTDESYKMTQRGQGELVLGVDVVSSAIGGLFGAICLMVAASLLAEVALQFTSFEYFWMAALGLSATVMVASGKPAKAGLSVLFGLLLSTVGVDITLGYPRFTFGQVELLGGISFIPAIVLFCIVGAFAINNSLFDVGVMLAMGVLGYILEVNGVPVAPVVLGLVLGPILEKNFMFSMTKSDWDMVEFFSRPVAAGLGLVTIAIWLTPIYPKLLRMVRREKAQEAGSA